MTYVMAQESVRESSGYEAANGITAICLPLTLSVDELENNT